MSSQVAFDQVDLGISNNLGLFFDYASHNWRHFLLILLFIVMTAKQIKENKF